jgi:hypothetical protein
MVEDVIPLPSQCNPQRFLLHRDMLIHAVMCWNRALDYVDVQLGGILDVDIRYITFEEFEPADLSPFYPLTTRDMRINPGLHWKPDARVDRALWQRITDYIRGIVTTDGAFLRDRIGTGGGYTWERGGPIKTDPDDPETWLYYSGDQDLLRGMQSGRYRPADWLYLNIVGEYHRLVGETIEPDVGTAEIVGIQGLYTAYYCTLMPSDKRTVKVWQMFVPPATLVNEATYDFNFAPRMHVISSQAKSRDVEQKYAWTAWDACGRRIFGDGDSEYVFEQYDWQEDIPNVNRWWDWIQHDLTYRIDEEYRMLQAFTAYLSVLKPNAILFIIAKRTNQDIIATVSYWLDGYGLYPDARIRIRYNETEFVSTARAVVQYATFSLVGAKGSQHAIYVEFIDGRMEIADEIKDRYEAYERTKAWNNALGQTIYLETRRIGSFYKRWFAMLIHDIPDVSFRLSFARA